MIPLLPRSRCRGSLDLTMHGYPRRSACASSSGEVGDYRGLGELHSNARAEGEQAGLVLAGLGNGEIDAGQGESDLTLPLQQTIESPCRPQGR